MCPLWFLIVHTKIVQKSVTSWVEVIIYILEKMGLKTTSGLWDITRTNCQQPTLKTLSMTNEILHITPNNIKLDPLESTHELSKDEKKNKKEFGKASYQAHKVGTSRLEKFGAQCQAQTNPAPSTVPKFSPSL